MSDAAALLTAEEVAKRLRVSPVSIYRWGKAGVLPSVTIGGVVRFRTADIDAIVSGEKPAPVEPDPKAAAS